MPTLLACGPLADGNVASARHGRPSQGQAASHPRSPHDQRQRIPASGHDHPRRRPGCQQAAEFPIPRKGIKRVQGSQRVRRQRRPTGHATPPPSRGDTPPASLPTVVHAELAHQMARIGPLNGGRRPLRHRLSPIGPRESARRPRAGRPETGCGQRRICALCIELHPRAHRPATVRGSAQAGWCADAYSRASVSAGLRSEAGAERPIEQPHDLLA